MANSKTALGKIGEDAAVKYLVRSGYKVIQRNFRCKMGELDIIAKHCNYTVFVEVRTIAGNFTKTPQESITVKKQQKVKQLAMLYQSIHDMWEVPVRFDVIAVTMNNDGSIKKIEHIPNAF
jgi:putative endonuclease